MCIHFLAPPVYTKTTNTDMSVYCPLSFPLQFYTSLCTYRLTHSARSSFRLWPHITDSTACRIFITIGKNVLYKNCGTNLCSTSLVVQWSESLTTNHEVPGSIPSSAVGIFLEGEDSRGDHCLGRSVEFRFKAPPGTTSFSINTQTIGTK